MPCPSVVVARVVAVAHGIEDEKEEEVAEEEIRIEEVKIEVEVEADVEVEREVEVEARNQPQQLAKRITRKQFFDFQHVPLQPPPL